MQASGTGCPGPAQLIVNEILCVGRHRPLKPICATMCGVMFARTALNVDVLVDRYGSQGSVNIGTSVEDQ